MQNNHFLNTLKQWLLLLRWHKPSGRMILLIPAGWSLWLTPNGPPSLNLILLIVSGGLCISGAGCIINDLWDRRIDQQVTRTKNRPLANGVIQISTAWKLLFLMLLLSFLVVLSLPKQSIALCLATALIALPIIFIYPSAKRWFAYPQLLLAICWGFSVLIPWAANESSLSPSWPLISCWGATLLWTFGFDTVYAMADLNDDKVLGLNSSVLSLGKKAKQVVATCYGFASLLLAIGAFFAGVGWIFWPIWVVASLSMQREIYILNNPSSSSKSTKSVFGSHFKNQVWIGGLILFGLIVGRIY